MPRLCKDCPVWTTDVVDEKGNPAFVDGKILGRCRGALPVLVTDKGQLISAFPPMLEDQWCYPGQFIEGDDIQKV